jgi:hypothetical protein
VFWGVAWNVVWSEQDDNVVWSESVGEVLNLDGLLAR